jgi:hypothetical protein
LTIQLLKITRGWEAEGLEKEVRVWFIHFSCFASSAPPSSTIQDHRNSNLEASGIAMTCSLHEAVPGSLQITVPVGDI